MAGCARVRPILKWAGGKFRLLDALLPELPAGGRFVEPFVGSGAVFMNVDYPSYLLCDVNADLIAFYRTLVERGAGFVGECGKLFTAAGNVREIFSARRRRFNRLPPGDARRAALFLYLNRHGYNGLVRYNARGEFNVPFGRYAKPRFPGAEMLAFLEKARSAEVEFAVGDFRDAFARVRHGDVVYCDPPYIPLSDTANFTCYSGNPFGRAEQEALAGLAERAAEAGAAIVVSNHDGPEARRLYRDASRIRRIDVRRSISCNGTRRAVVGELIAVYDAREPRAPAGRARPRAVKTRAETKGEPET